MCFERIAAVGAEENDASTGNEGAYHLVDRQAVVLDVFDHFMAEDQVKH